MSSSASASSSKTGAGFDPLTSAPTPITEQQRLEAGIDFDPFAQDASDD